MVAEEDVACDEEEVALGDGCGGGEPPAGSWISQRLVST